MNRHLIIVNASHGWEIQHPDPSVCEPGDQFCLFHEVTSVRDVSCVEAGTYVAVPTGNHRVVDIGERV